VRTLSLDLAVKHNVQINGWFRYDLEAGYDYIHVEYSLNGGASGNPTPPMTFNGLQNEWQQVTVDIPMLDNQSNDAVCIRHLSDPVVTEDGVYVDDFALSSIPYECNYDLTPNAPSMVAPANGSWLNSTVTFVWQPAEEGAPLKGYVFYLDDTPVVTFTSPISTTTLDVTPWELTWLVKASNITGIFLPSASWSLNIFGKLCIPLTDK
jgi:outer membrane receptor protein involved in Fe transport